jgi:hypothetical protein
MANTTPTVDVQKYLSGISFPADKQTLIQYAKNRGAPQNLISALNGIPNRSYDSIEDVSDELIM